MVLAWWLWAAIVLCVIAIPGLVLAQAYQVTEGGVTISLYQEPCRLKEAVTNLPYRAVWTEGGKDVEGCFAIRAEAGIVVFYFADKTVGIAPAKAFSRVTGT